jgi:hypothetical protein
MADTPKAEQKDKAATEDPKFPFSEIRANPAGFGYRAHILDGAGAHNGWKAGTRLSKDDLKKGVTDWLKSPVTEEA